MSGEQVREWRDVVGWGGKYVGVYQVSNDGCVRRVKTGHGATVGLILKPTVSTTGYLVVALCVDGKQDTRKVHQLVAQAFIPNPDNKYAVDHIDRNKVHNHVSNLRWATKSENQINTAGRSNTGMKHISKTRSNGKPVFNVRVARGGKAVVNKNFGIRDRDEAEVLAEAVAYHDERCAELGIEVDDRQADGAVDRDADGSVCAQLQPILEYIRDNVIRRDGTETDADA
jgi:hypothetical protein